MSILVTCLCGQAGAEAGKKPKFGNKMELLEVPFNKKRQTNDCLPLQRNSAIPLYFF